jgi:hypothetical protein
LFEIKFFQHFKIKTKIANLFSIGRSKDANEIFYALNLDKSNRLNPENPVHVCWVKRSQKSKLVPLIWIQKKMLMV